MRWERNKGILKTKVRRTKSFISEISLSTSSMNWIIKSTSLCFNIASVWKLVIRNEMSYPYWGKCTYENYVWRSLEVQDLPTFTGFLRRMKNDSARCVKNLVNLWTNMFSISSACFIRMLTRTLFTLGSIKTFSFSLRATVNELRSNSGELAASISGTLCRSEVCEAKLQTASAAARDDRTHCKYGRSDCDYSLVRQTRLGLMIWRTMTKIRLRIK